MIDARKGEVFYAFYRQTDHGIQRVLEPMVGSIDDLISDLLGRGQETLCVGDGAVRYRVRIAGTDQPMCCAGCAAVADYRVVEVAGEKMKKQGDSALELKLVQNPDIIASVAALTQNRPFTVGFAAETQNVLQYAKDKLARKKLDMICANDVSGTELGFNSDHNAVTLLWQDGEQALAAQPKDQLAHAIVQQILARFSSEN